MLLDRLVKKLGKDYGPPREAKPVPDAPNDGDKGPGNDEDKPVGDKPKKGQGDDPQNGKNAPQNQPEQHR
jgi:hypothetical protein